MEVDDVVDLSVGSGRESLTITHATARDLRALTQNSGLTITPAPPPSTVQPPPPQIQQQQITPAGGSEEGTILLLRNFKNFFLLIITFLTFSRTNA